MIKKFNQLFENNNYNIKQLEKIYKKFHDKNCIVGLSYLMETTNINPNFDVGDGTTLTYIDEYFGNVGDKEDLIDLIKILIKKGADINALDINGLPPIILSKNYDISRLFLDADCDLNIIVNEEGEDVLEYDNILKEIVKKEYPEKYQVYLRNKQMNKFNI